VFSQTTSKGDVQNKEYIVINSDSISIALMTTGTLVLLLLSVVKMSTDIVTPISNKNLKYNMIPMPIQY
jgi:hypothetical protein